MSSSRLASRAGLLAGRQLRARPARAHSLRPSHGLFRSTPPTQLTRPQRTSLSAPLPYLPPPRSTSPPPPPPRPRPSRAPRPAHDPATPAAGHRAAHAPSPSRNRAQSRSPQRRPHRRARPTRPARRASARRARARRARSAAGCSSCASRLRACAMPSGQAGSTSVRRRSPLGIDHLVGVVIVCVVRAGAAALARQGCSNAAEPRLVRCGRGGRPCGARLRDWARARATVADDARASRRSGERLGDVVAAAAENVPPVPPLPGCGQDVAGRSTRTRSRPRRPATATVVPQAPPSVPAASASTPREGGMTSLRRAMSTSVLRGGGEWRADPPRGELVRRVEEWARESGR